MRYKQIDSRIPALVGLTHNMPIAGYCKLVLDGDQELVFVVGRMSGFARSVSLDQSIKGSDDAPILAYYRDNTPESRQKRPVYVYLSQLEECVWLGKSSR